MKGITRLVFFPDEGVMDRSVGTALLEKTHSQIHNCKIILLLIIIMHSNFHTKEEGFKIYSKQRTYTLPRRRFAGPELLGVLQFCSFILLHVTLRDCSPHFPSFPVP